MNIQQLLATFESETFDRKRQFHINRAELLHDILCLANAYGDSERYLLFGQADDGKIVGVGMDPSRLTNAQLSDFLRGSSLNRIPAIRLEELNVEGLLVVVLHIRNRPDKPFFAMKDKRDGASTVRAGVIYTRIGDTNVPMGESAPDDMIELMWRERFGLGLDARTRFYRLIEQTSQWTRIRGHRVYQYHDRFPEFTVEEADEKSQVFDEPWTRKFPDKTAYKYTLEVRYLTTTLERWSFVSCDGGRYHIPLPEHDGTGNFSLPADSPKLKLARQLWQQVDLGTALGRAEIRLV